MIQAITNIYRTTHKRNFGMELIKNGDFSQQEQHWTATEPKNVRYITGGCVIGHPTSISQDVMTGNGGGGKFMLRALVKVLQGQATEITVKPHPTGEPIVLTEGSALEWASLSKPFEVPTATIKFTVTLRAVNATGPTPDAYFGGLSLIKLL
jgi:hypothetical protein